MRFLIQQVIETPIWLQDREILRRIESTGAVERIRAIQVRRLNNLLDPARMQRMIESEVFDGGAYPLVEYLGDLKDGVWRELAAAEPIDTYRRNLQRGYLERLEWLMTEEPDAPSTVASGSSRGGAPSVDVSQSDIRPLLRAQLKEIRQEAQRASTRTRDRMTRGTTWRISSNGSTLSWMEGGTAKEKPGRDTIPTGLDLPTEGVPSPHTATLASVGHHNPTPLTLR